MATTTLTKPEPDASPETSRARLAIASGRSSVSAILALDLGTKAGWALRTSDGHIISGTAEFRHDRWQGGGIKFLKFKRWLTELKNCAGGIDAVFFEAVRGHTGVDSSHAYGGWLAILTAWCEHHEIPYEGVPVGTIKRFIAGKGNADKAAVIVAVKALGFDPQDHNEADAIALLQWAIAHGAGAADV